VFVIETSAALRSISRHGSLGWRPWAVIPAKRFARAKSRLGSVLQTTERRELACSMFERVLGACSACPELEGVLVATDGDEVAALGARHGASVLRDPSRSLPLAAVVDAALGSLTVRGATHALVVMADLPWIRSCDIGELLAQLRTEDVVVTPDLKRRGTSALGVRLDLGLRSCFGHADSLQRHLDEAARVRARSAVVHNPRIAFDIDSATDLSALRLAGAAGPNLQCIGAV
jgi:2-phospho-L-lactate guanylyltransferase